MTVAIEQTRLIETPLDISDLTTTYLTGNGTLDVLMATFTNHLDREYNQGRILGNDYASAYIAGFEAVLSAATEFTLAKERQALELTRLQLENDVLELQKIGLELDNDTKSYNLKFLLPAQKANTEAQTANVAASTSKLIEETKLLPVQLLLAQEELALTKEKILQAKEETLLSKEKLKLAAEEVLLAKEKIKLAYEELALAKQRVITEQAQTDPSVIKVGSVIDKTNKVLDQQVLGFQRDAEQKVAKMLIDTWVVRRNTDDAEDANTTNKLNNDYIGKAVTKLLSGIDVV